MVATRWIEPDATSTAIVTNDPLGRVVARIG
jgi:hypothetical protein